MIRAASLVSLVALLSACGNGGYVCSVSDDDFACHRGVTVKTSAVGSTCSPIDVDDGQPCRTGFGICQSGVCMTSSPPDAPTACGTTIPVKTDACGTDSDCFNASPCIAVHSCPMPGESCLYEPEVDGTRCGSNLVCGGGICCTPQKDFACTSDSGCVATEDCTFGTCKDNLCVFARRSEGDSCVVAAEAGICVVENIGDVPRCETTP